MNQKTDRPVLIDFFALSGTGKSTHTKTLFDHLTAKGFKVKILNFRLLRYGKNGHSQRQPISTLFKSISMGCVFFRLSSKKTELSKISTLIKWSYRLLVYNSQIRSYNSEGLDYIIVDPSLSSQLKKFYQYFDDDSFIEAVSFLEKKKLTSDIVVIIEADIDIVKKRRLARGSLEEATRDSATFSVKKAFSEIEQRNTSINFVTVGYNCFSSLESNIQQITELCGRVKSQL